MKAEEVFVNCYKFNPIKSKKVIFKVPYLIKLPEPKLESEPKKYFWLHNTASKKYTQIIASSLYTM
jgi:hypothetical protein